MLSVRSAVPFGRYLIVRNSIITDERSSLTFFCLPNMYCGSANRQFIKAKIRSSGKRTEADFFCNSQRFCRDFTSLPKPGIRDAAMQATQSGPR